MRKRGVCVSACPAGTLSNCSAWASRTHSSPWATVGLFFLSVPLPGFHFVFMVTPHNPFIQPPVSHKLPVAPAATATLTVAFRLLQHPAQPVPSRPSQTYTPALVGSVLLVANKSTLAWSHAQAWGLGFSLQVQREDELLDAK